jgi:hypothetical protein
MELRLKVVPKDGEPYEVETDLAIIVAWERKFKRKASDLANGIGMEDLSFLAYEATRSAGMTIPAVFDDFIKRIRRVEAVEADTASPTQGAPSDGS